MPTDRLNLAFNFYCSFLFNLFIRKATTIQIVPTPNHNHLKPKCSATCDPPSGPSVCAADQAIVYNAAYCPLFPALVLAIQKLFINGMEKISPMVRSDKAKKAIHGPIPGRFSIINEIPTSVIPKEI